MAKNSKNQESNGTAEASNGETELKAKKRTKSPARVATSKPAAKKTAKKTAPRKTAKKTGGYEPSDDEIRLRAYFIAERRVQMSVHADPAEDWLEARRQLVEEADQRGTTASSS